MIINTEKLNGEGNFNFYPYLHHRQTGRRIFSRRYCPLKKVLVCTNYAEWTNANPQGMYFGVDLNGDGQIDDEYVVDDNQP
ncbi:MAG: hypothetical protein U0Z26_19610 [Anaerolineales bacterium]